MSFKTVFISFVSLILIVSIISCSQDKAEWQGTIEEVDGVTVVKNLINPSSDAMKNLKLQESFIIDFEKENLAEVGIADITGFDIDSKGNIYCWTIQSSENFVFKFSSTGVFLGAFGRLGQGPGEIRLPYLLTINQADEIQISDRTRFKLITFDANGKFIKEMSISQNHEVATLISNDKILALEANFILEEGVTHMPIVMCDLEFNKLKTLHPGHKIPNWVRAKEINGLKTNKEWFPWSISGENIFIGNENNGYELLVYDFNGALKKKISKDYDPVPVSESIKNTVYKAMLRPQLEQFNIKEKIFFPDSMPPFQYFFTDDIRRLYVMTNEKGENSKEYIYDIFNPEGIFIGRTKLDNSGNELNLKWGGPFEAKSKNNLLYHLRQKESGFKELVVHNMIWE